MRNYRTQAGWLVIWLSFFIAFLLQIMPCPDEMLFFQPNWLFLVLLYWTFSLPKKVNITTSLIVGIILDIISGSTLGIRALALIIISYFITLKFQFSHTLVFWQQIIIVILLSLIVDIIIFLMEYLVNKATFQLKVFWNSVINGIMWPWLFLLIRKMCK